MREKAEDGGCGFSKDCRVCAWEELVTPCQTETRASVPVCGRVPTLLEDKPESTHGFGLKWLELGRAGIVSKVSPDVLERS